MDTEAFIGQVAVKITPVKMDVLDRKILYLLWQNARLSNTAIAKHLNLSREIVAYRIKRLQELKVLPGFLTLINAQKTGRLVQFVGLKLKSTAKGEKVLAALEKIPQVIQIKQCSGIFDILFGVMTKNINETYAILQGILSHHITSVVHHEIFTRIEQCQLPIGFLIEDKKEQAYLNEIRESKGTAFQKEFKNQKRDTEIAQLDALDEKILHQLKLNARIPVTELAKNISASVFQVTSKIKSLITNDIIQAFVPYFSPVYLGYQWFIIFVRVQEDLEKKFVEWIKQYPQIVWYAKNLGLYNYQLSVFARNNAHLSDILNIIGTEFGENIESIEPLLVFLSKRSVTFV